MALQREALYLGHTQEQLEQRIAYYGGKCWICRVAPWEHIDHVKPLSKGGAHILANLRPSCASCNLGKSDKWPFVPAMILINQSAYALAN
ncbi:HNH endonuclease signature motif containing protein [Micromonospora sp. HB375]|uniref:HNH endonuclease n=1 Tax=Micromonospora sp. HB375 TaxID=767364 RepID=UPI001AE9F977